MDGSGAFTVCRADTWLTAGTGLGVGDALGAADKIVGYASSTSNPPAKIAHLESRALPMCRYECDGAALREGDGPVT